MLLCVAFFIMDSSYLVGRDSSVGIVTRYGLDGPGIKSRWGKISRTHPDRPRGPPSLLYYGYRVFPRGKVAGVWPPSNTEVKERVELYFYSPSGPLWLVIGWTLIYLSYLGSASHSHSLLGTRSKIFTHKNVEWSLQRCDTVCHWVIIFWHFKGILVLSFGWSCPRKIAMQRKGLTETWLVWVVAGHRQWSANHQVTASIRLCKTVISTYLC